jgi:hypothetical protein
VIRPPSLTEGDVLLAYCFWRVWLWHLAKPASLVRTLPLAICLTATPGLAHGPYTGWQRPDVGGSCCNDADCSAASDFRIVGGQYEVQFQNRWIVVPPEKVLHGVRNPDGNPHLCAIPLQGGGVTIFCFLPPSAT